TGSGTSLITFNVPRAAGSGSGDNSNTGSQAAFFSVSSGAPVFALGQSGIVTTGLSITSNVFAIKGNNAGGLLMYRHTTANTAGNNLTVQAGGATSGATDKNAGTLILTSGIATGQGSGIIQFQTSKAQGSTNTTDNSLATVMTLDGSGNLRIGDATAPTATLDVLGKMTVNSSGLITKHNNVATAGWGVPSIYGYGRSTAQTAAVASVATYTVGAADGSFIVSANVLVTTSTTHSFSVQMTYTDEGNTSRTVTFNVQQLGGTLVTSITNVTGASAYEGIPLHIRAKAATVITILTSGTFTSVTYNVEGVITQVA
ncbi:MAG TPA: hypothetical protein VNZ45_07020, partial [Bacteroidia bacterium]|nr:hypothetical protein [Bacteroidia bacterium]